MLSAILLIEKEFGKYYSGNGRNSVVLNAIEFYLEYIFGKFFQLLENIDGDLNI